MAKSVLVSQYLFKDKTIIANDMRLLLAGLKSGQLGLQGDLPVQTHVYSYGGNYPLDAHLHKPVIGFLHQLEELLEAIGLH